MSTEVCLPSVGFSTQTLTLAEFFVADGEAVKAGQPLYAVETDKSVQEIEAPASGTLKILKAEGEVYAVGEVIAEII